MAKALTQDEAEAIRAEYALGTVTMADLAARFGVSLSAVHRAIHRLTKSTR